jgi:hypothetical protein
MKKLIIVSALLAAMFNSGTAQGGIFGRRGRQPTNGYRSTSQPTTSQPTTSQPTTNPFPFNSRSDPRDWKEAHRGYGIKIRGW